MSVEGTAKKVKGARKGLETAAQGVGGKTLFLTEIAIDRVGNGMELGIPVFKDTGRFVGHKTLEVGGERIMAEAIVIAAGTRPRILDIDGRKFQALE